MGDELRGSPASRSYVPNLFSRLLESTSGGHALWRPRDSVQRGGVLGDCGYIADGVFWRICNCYDSPVPGVPLLARPSRENIDVEEVTNNTVFRSSLASTVTFSASLPFNVPPTTITFRTSLASKDASFAFLSFAGPHRVETRISRPETQRQRYLQKHQAALEKHAAGEVFIVCSTITASGWLSGLSHRQETGASADASVALPLAGEFRVGASCSVTSANAVPSAGDAMGLSSDGPVNWSLAGPIRYPVVLGAVHLRRRWKGSIHRMLGIATSRGQTPHDSLEAQDSAIPLPSDPTLGAGTTDQLPAHEDRDAGGSHNQRAALNLEVQDRRPELTGGPLGPETSGGSLSDAEKAVDSDEEGNSRVPSLIDLILDDFLRRNDGIDAVVCDTNLIKQCLGNLQGTSLDAGTFGLPNAEAGLTQPHSAVQEEAHIGRRLPLTYAWDEERDGEEVTASLIHLELDRQEEQAFFAASKDYVMSLNNIFQAYPRSIQDISWSEGYRNQRWTATVDLTQVGRFTGTGENRKEARDAAAYNAVHHLSLR